MQRISEFKFLLINTTVINSLLKGTDDLVIRLPFISVKET